MKWLALKYQTKLIKSKDISKFVTNEIANNLLTFFSFHRMFVTIFRRNHFYEYFDSVYSLEMITYKNDQWTKHEIDNISNLQSLGNIL